MTAIFVKSVQMERKNIDVCETLMPPFPNISRIGLTFHLNINAYHLLVMDYLPTRFEGSEAKYFWVISCTRGGDQHDLWPCPLTWKLIGIVYSLRTIYLTSLKLLGQSVRLHKVLQTNMTFDLDLWSTDLNIDRDHLLIMDYLPTEFEVFEARGSLVIRCTIFFLFFFWGGGGGGRGATDELTDRHVQSHMPLPSFEGGIIILLTTWF